MSVSVNTGSRRVAVIGGGISGLSAAWLLARSCDVTLYERERRAGGHANTVVAQRPDGPVNVDTGFIVYNDRNYPNLIALFDMLGVVTQPSDMSFAVSLQSGGVEYSGSNLNGLFARRRNALSPRFWRMMRDVQRFYRAAPLALLEPEAATGTLGDYLEVNGYSTAFRDDHLLPMAAAIWSSSPGDILAFPLATFVRFFDSHGLLSLSHRPQWRTVSGGSINYVNRIATLLGDRLRIGAPVVEVRQSGGLHIVRDASGAEDSFTDVVFAIHADDILPLLANPCDAQRAVLGAFRYSDNVAVLHADATLMPMRRAAWASWNYLGAGHGSDASLVVTYWMNRLQRLGGSELFVTLNPDPARPPHKVYRTERYRHPLFNAATLAAQRQLWSIQGQSRLWYCGAWCGYGFHEDGVQAGLAVAEDLAGAPRPWSVGPADERIFRQPWALP